MGIFGRGRGKGRKTLLQYHRLYEFERAFDKYLIGECDSEYLAARAKLMLQAGIPERLR